MIQKQFLNNENNNEKTEKQLFFQSSNDDPKIVDSLTLRLPQNQFDISYDKYSEL